MKQVKFSNIGPICLAFFCLFFFIPTTNGGFLDFFSGSLFSPPAIDHSQALDIIQRTSCWHRPQVKELIHEHCLAATLSDEGRYRLAIALANCHLSASGLKEIPCDNTMLVEDCTRKIPNIELAFSTYTTFFAHIDSLCFYMKKDNFHQSTADAINALAIATIQSKETLIEFSQDLAENQEKLQTTLSDHIDQEDVRFKKLIEGLANAQTLLQYIGLGQERISQQSDQIVEKTNEINTKQYQTLDQLGLVSHKLTEFEEMEKERFEITLGRMLLFEDHMKQQSETFNSTYNHLTTHVLQTHTHLHSLSSQLANDLAQTRGQLSALIHDVFFAIQNLHIELISFTSLLFYPVLFILIFLFTSTSRAYNARLWLYILLGVVFLFERSLAKGGHVSLHIAHFIMCSMRYTHAFILTTLLRLAEYIFGAGDKTNHVQDVIKNSISVGNVLTTGSDTTNTFVNAVPAVTTLYGKVLSCTSCIITQYSVVTWAMKSFTIFDNSEYFNQIYDKLSEQPLPPLALTADEYVGMIEVTRILFLFIAAFIWSMTVILYRDPLHHIEARVDKVMAKLSLLDSSIASFKQKMLVWSQAVHQTTKQSLSSFNKTMSPLITPVLSGLSFMTGTNDVDGPLVVESKNLNDDVALANKPARGHPLDASNFTPHHLNADKNDDIMKNGKKGGIMMITNSQDDYNILIPRSPKEARSIPIASHEQISPMVARTRLSERDKRSFDKVSSGDVGKLAKKKDKDGDAIYLPTPSNNNSMDNGTNMRNTSRGRKNKQPESSFEENDDKKSKAKVVTGVNKTRAGSRTRKSTYIEDPDEDIVEKKPKRVSTRTTRSTV